VQLLLFNTNEIVLILAYTNRAVDEICSSLNKIENEKCNNDRLYIRLGNRDASEHKEKLLSNIPLENIFAEVRNCRCFVSTVATANSSPELFQLKQFDTIIIDEAAQILECNIVGLLAKAKRFIMIGDEKQLPAVTTLSNKELEINNELLNSIEINNLGNSLFERLLSICRKNNWDAFSMLHTQSRMNEKIMQLANKLFYNNELKISNQHLPNKINNKKTPPLRFINSSIEKNNKVNYSEIEIVLELINEIKLDFGDKFNSQTLGIISPWRMQCNAIINRLSKEDKKNIAVDTVERFQGTEREIIIFSAATNNERLLNLLSDSKLIDDILIDRKLNVSITRAKHNFIFIGNYELLSKKEIYKQLIDIIVAQ
jgi:DNA replication ATP-dependent helicase Dna2